MNKLQLIAQTIDSREVAEMVEKEHGKLLRDIRSYSEYLNEAKIGLVDFFFESTYIDAKGETRPNYQVTKKGCEFIAHKLTGQKGAIFTAKYINRFHEMEQFIKERNSREWQDLRQEGKRKRLQETEVIKAFVQYAESQGSRNAKRYYISYSNLANKAAGITSRDKATTMQLHNLYLVENVILNVIAEEMEKGVSYKVIYDNCKEKVQQFQSLAYFNNLMIR